MSQVFRVLPFGSNWCIAFFPQDDAEGLIAVRTSEEEVREILQAVERLLDAGADIHVGIPGDDHRDEFPGVSFSLESETEVQVVSWIGMTGPSPLVQRTTAGKLRGPGVLTHDILSKHWPSAAPYPSSLRGVGRRSIRFRISERQAGSDDVSSKVVFATHGEMIQLAREAVLTGLDAVVVSLPLELVAGESSIGSVVHCDESVAIWAESGRGHPVLGPCIQLGLASNVSARLSKASRIAISEPEQSSEHGWVDQLVPVLDERAQLIEASLLLSYEPELATHGAGEFRRLHRQHRSALRGRQWEEARAALSGIFNLSEKLDRSDFTSRHPRNSSDGDPAMLADFFRFGAVICCYVAGDFQRNSPSYQEDKSFRVFSRSTPQRITEAYRAIFGIRSRQTRIDLALSDRVG